MASVVDIGGPSGVRDILGIPVRNVPRSVLTLVMKVNELFLANSNTPFRGATQSTSNRGQPTQDFNLTLTATEDFMSILYVIYTVRSKRSRDDIQVAQINRTYEAVNAAFVLAKGENVPFVTISTDTALQIRATMDYISEAILTLGLAEMYITVRSLHRAQTGKSRCMTKDQYVGMLPAVATEEEIATRAHIMSISTAIAGDNGFQVAGDSLYRTANGTIVSNLLVHTVGDTFNIPLVNAKIEQVRSWMLATASRVVNFADPIYPNSRIWHAPMFGVANKLAIAPYWELVLMTLATYATEVQFPDPGMFWKILNAYPDEEYEIIKTYIYPALQLPDDVGESTPAEIFTLWITAITTVDSEMQRQAWCLLHTAIQLAPLILPLASHLT